MERRLAAIMATDVVGYSRLIRDDEEDTLAALKALRADLIDPKIAEHHGRIVKLMGDGMLAEFASVVDAVRAAVETQQGVNERNAGLPDDKRIEFRVGINLGDVVIDGDDIHGDGVNVAARLEGMAEPGGICVSGMVYEGVRDRIDIPFEDLGEQEVKNIDRPVRVWRWVKDDEAALVGPFSASKPQPLSDKPSIAVLPFDNMSGDPEQEYFADGIAEDLITALSRFPWLFVIARNSSFTYKGRSVPVKQVGRDLGVRYVVEGSVRRSDTRLRVAAQLIDATTSHHVWAERYDRPIGDLFDLQDDITEMITGVLVPALGSAERERASRKLRPSLDAWEMYQRGLLHYYRPYSHDDHAEARRLFDRAIELDPDFADAHAIVGLMGVYAVNSGQSSYSSSPQETLAEAARAAERAVQLEDNNALAHIALGRANDLMGNLETGIAECETAVRLNPNLAVAHHELGFVLVHAGRAAEALSCFDKAIRLSPNDPSRWNFFLLKGGTQFQLGEHESAIGNLKTAARLRPTSFWPHILSAAALVGLGRMDEARAAVREALSRKPDCTLAMISQISKNRRSEYTDKLLDHLQKAGLPE